MSGFLQRSTLVTSASRFVEAVAGRNFGNAGAIVHGDLAVSPLSSHQSAQVDALLADGRRMSYAASRARFKGEPL